MPVLQQIYGDLFLQTFVVMEYEFSIKESDKRSLREVCVWGGGGGVKNGGQFDSCKTFPFLPANNDRSLNDSSGVIQPFTPSYSLIESIQEL